MNEFEEIFSRPWSCRTMPCSRTIKTKSNGVLPGRSNEHKCPLWRVQIVPFLRRLSRLDLKEEESYKRPSSSLLFSAFSCTVSFSLRASPLAQIPHSVFRSNFLTHIFFFFRRYLFSAVYDSWWVETPSKGFHLLPASPVSLCTSHSVFTGLLRAHESYGIYFRCYLADQQEKSIGLVRF